eukprot:gene4518-5114_t
MATQTRSLQDVCPTAWRVAYNNVFFLQFISVLPESRKRRLPDDYHECRTERKVPLLLSESDVIVPDEMDQVETMPETSFLIQAEDTLDKTVPTTTEEPVTEISDSPFVNIELTRSKPEQKPEEAKTSTSGKPLSFQAMKIKPIQISSLNGQPKSESPDKKKVVSVTDDGRAVRKTITVRKRVVKRIIQLPDGSTEEIEEEIPDDGTAEIPDDFVVIGDELPSPGKIRVPLKEPRHVERLYVTRILRQTDGTERVLETSETVSPMQPEPEDEDVEREKVEEVKDRLGRVKKTIHRSPAFVIRKKKVTKESRILPHGKEEPEKTTAVEPEETQEVEAPVIRRVVKLVTRDSDGKEEVVEKTVTVKPFEIIESKEDGEPKVTEKREKGKNVRIVKRKLVETRQQNIRKKVTKKPDGKQEGPVEEEAIKPVEPVSYRIVRKTVRHGDGTVQVTENLISPCQTMQRAYSGGGERQRGRVVRRITTKPVPMLTRKVYRKSLLQ